ncbi:uncharacterized protein [Drosophila kikkawai]|uniref:Uncharacterized protein n=1 Tax=Drosophila kikkawai TaxID=30033 RepID=A0A6P4JB33_DROKI|nr:uncharacterized protein LOC108081522 [Drosophila kikkawai]
MFENISFLFLFAMAFFSWAVLCLQHAVEIQRRAASDYRVEMSTERPGITFEPHVLHKTSETSPLSGAFDIAMSFWMILALTFALSKLLQLVERQVKMYLKSHETRKPGKALTGDPAVEQMEEEETMDPVMVEENTALREQLGVLHTHCLEMRELLHELRLSKSSTSQESAQPGDQVVVTVKQGTSSIPESVSASTQPLHRIPDFCPLSTDSSQHSQNIYITNRHIHIRGPVFCLDNIFSVELCRQASLYARKQSEFLQVWGKYITERKERPMIPGMRCNNILL